MDLYSMDSIKWTLFNGQYSMDLYSVDCIQWTPFIGLYECDLNIQ